ncbi:MAG: T9SS type A sorting domain-containing protein [Chloroflexota bacterium]
MNNPQLLPQIVFMPLKKSVFLLLIFFPILTTHAQTVVNVGSESTLDIATWNIEWFGSASNGPSNDNLQISNAEAIISGSGIDLWGVQEIADGDDFDAMVAALGDDYDGTLATNSVEQKVGFIYNTNVIQVRQVKHILESFNRAFASRPPLQLEADVILPDTTLIVTFIVLHMKAFSDLESYERRVDASSRLKNHIDFTSLDNDKVIVLGDFNDELEQSTSSGRTSPYENFVQDSDDYFFLTLPLEQSGEGSFCTTSSCTSTGSMLDHLLITDELFSDYIPNSAGFIPDLTSAISVFGNSTSDHLPVIARFDFTRVGTSVDDLEERPSMVKLHTPYPNPFWSSTTLSVTLTEPTQIKVEIFDMLGRHVDTLIDQMQSPGTYQYNYKANARPPGVYMIRVSAENFAETLPVTLLK